MNKAGVLNDSLAEIWAGDVDRGGMAMLMVMTMIT